MTKQQQNENYSLQRKLVEQKPLTPRDVYKVITKKKKKEILKY